jgi:ribonuclease T1
MIVVVVLLGAFGVDRWASSPATSSTGTSSGHVSGVATPHSGLLTVAAGALPAQAQAVLVLIDNGGPFRYAQDNTVFSNFEGLLPKRASGYYREYTVITPGSTDRGERRLVAGLDGDVYYTDDHYNSFRQVIR